MKTIFTLLVLAISLFTAFTMISVIGESTEKLNQAFTVQA